MWKSTATAPLDRNLQLGVIDTAGEVHALIFPCRRVLRGWVNSQTGSPVFPTHWREWGGIIEEAPIGGQSRIGWPLSKSTRTICERSSRRTAMVSTKKPVDPLRHQLPTT